MITDGDGEGKKRNPKNASKELATSNNGGVGKACWNTLWGAMLDFLKIIFESKGGTKGSLHMISKDTKGAKKYYWGTMVENIIYYIYFKPQGP